MVSYVKCDECGDGPAEEGTGGTLCVTCREAFEATPPFTPDGCAQAARIAIEAWPHHMAVVAGEHATTEDNLADLLADLMHYARTEEIDFDEAVLRASGHYEAELDEAGIVVFGGTLADDAR